MLKKSAIVLGSGAGVLNGNAACHDQPFHRGLTIAGHCWYEKLGRLAECSAYW